MFNESLKKEDIEEMRKDLGVVYFGTRFNMFKSHNGFRPGCLHGIIGTKGSGKSSFAQTIISDLIRSKKVLVWLSEEKQVNYQLKINNINESHNENLRFIEERLLKNNLNKRHDEFLEMAGREILNANVDIVVIDNITSSRFYSSIYNQEESAEWFSKFLKDTNIAIVYLAHTKKEISDNSKKILVGEDIRGNAIIVIRTEYLYVLQKYTNNIGWDVIVYLEKSRYHEIKGTRYFLLEYKEGFYHKDVPIDFERFNKIYSNREFLGRRQQ